MTQKLNNPHNGSSTITHEEISTLPLKTFKGPIAVINEKKLLPTIFEEIETHEVVGFDTETRPSFKKGQVYKVALLQIAIPDKVFLIRLQQTGITPEVIRFLEEESILKTGVGVRDDIMAIHRIKKFKAGGFVDLAAMAREAGLQVESVKKLTGLLLGFRISKSSQTSNWEADKLTKKQIEYAATDAWVCLELYRKLTAMTN